MLIFLVAFLYLFSRLLNLVKFPIFADEAIYIRWSQYILNDWTQKFIPLTDGKPPLHMWLMIPYLKIFSDPLLGGRLFSVTCGIFSLLGIYLLTRQLFDKKSAIISVFLYLFLPFSLIYDRLALTDGPLLMFLIWFLFFLSKLMHEFKYKYAILAGIFLGLSLLTKPTALFFFPIILISLILVKKFNKQSIIKIFTFLLIIAILSIGIYGILKLSPFFQSIYRRSSEYSFTIKEFLGAPIYTLTFTLSRIIPWTISYFTIPIILIFLGGFFYSLFKGKEKPVIFLFLIFLLFFSVNAVFGRVIYPRYFLIFLPSIISVSSYFIAELVNKLQVKMKVLVIALVLLPSLVFDWFLIFNPLKTPFVEVDRIQYLTDWPSGIGIREIVNYFKPMPDKNKIYVYTEGFFGTLPDGLAIFLNNEGIGVDGVGVPVLGIPEKAFEKLDQGYQVYLVANSTRVKIDDPRVQKIQEYPKPPKKSGEIEKLILFRINK